MMKFATTKNKYKNKKVEHQGIKFDSKKELKRYIELKELENKGIISNLNLQVKFNLQPKFVLDGKTIRAIDYIADFVYTKNNEEIIEDVKGSKYMITEVFKIKKKMFEYKYKKTINIII